MQLSKQQIIDFQAKILSWYSANKRELPWRKSRDPYRILLSEIMLQQTQVSRVIPKYEAWLRALPTIDHLAKATTADVLSLWSGLGYNRRALFLQKAAKTIVFDHKGIWPQSVAELKNLPGIGEYTARAVACFAFDEQVAVVDTNVKKVIAVELFAGVLPEDKTISKIADALLPHGKAYDWNQGLMDYASTMLKKEKIPIPRQSTFKGSRRYYRGKIIKLLLERREIEEHEIISVISDAKANAEHIQSILTDLKREGFILQKNEKIMIS